MTRASHDAPAEWRRKVWVVVRTGALAWMGCGGNKEDLGRAEAGSAHVPSADRGSSEASSPPVAAAAASAGSSTGHAADGSSSTVDALDAATVLDAGPSWKGEPLALMEQRGVRR